MFKNVGYVKADGTLALLPTLTPKTKAPGPPSSPTRVNRFPAGTDPNDPSGIISPTSPVGKEFMNWPKAQKPAGPGRGINKIPCDTKDVRIGDGSVLPPAHARSKSYRDAAMAQGGDHGRSLPKVALPGQAGSSFDGQRIVTGVPGIKLDVNRGTTPYESSACVPRINQVSKFVTTYLRHGVEDQRLNVHSQDGYVRVAILVQLPEFRKNKVDHKLLELVMMNAYPGIMMNPEGTHLKAIQGHTLERFDIDQLHEKLNTTEQYVHHPLWRNEDPPDQLVFELSNENYMDNRRRMGTFAPSVNKRFHTMKAVRGTARQDFGATNVTLCVYIRMRALFEFRPNIEMYITQSGRIVTKCGLPWSAFTMVRRNNDEGSVINKDQDRFLPPPAAPAGPKRVRSRDYKGSASYPTNDTQLPMPDGKARTKHGDKELTTGFYNMLPHKCYGTTWEQHRQLQMLKGVYKTERCMSDTKNRRCTKGDECCFTHSTDNDMNIEAVVMPLRRKIFTELFNEEFSLPLGHLHEIDKITTQVYHEALRKKEDFEDRTGGRFQRPREHDNSRSPRSSPSNRDSVTPEPQRPKGSGNGEALALMNINEDTSERQRDHTSGDNVEDEDSDREEAVAPIDVNEIIFK